MRGGAAVSVDTFVPTATWDSVDIQADYIMQEAKATVCPHLQLQDAVLVLIFERWERGILNKDERDRLVKRLYE